MRAYTPDEFFDKVLSNYRPRHAWRVTHRVCGERIALVTHRLVLDEAMGMDGARIAYEVAQFLRDLGQEAAIVEDNGRFAVEVEVVEHEA